MKRFRNILLVVPADGTDTGPAMERATELALRNAAPLTITSTVEEVPKRLIKQAQRQGIDLQAALVGARTRELEQLAGKYQSEDLAVGVSVDVGVPFVEIIRRVLRNGHDLVITPQEAGLTGFESRTKHLLRKCPCPVWVVRPGPARHLKVLAAVDPDAPIGDPLCRLILDLATSLTILEDGELHIVHAWEMEGEATLRSSPYVSMSAKEVDLLVEVTHDEHTDGLNILLGHYDLSAIDHEVHLVKGDPGRVIPSLVVEQDINLVVMGTVARTGVAGLVIGNTAELILDAMDCSVLAVKPEGFVSPVTLAS
jgi:nucleotide-binding universal stress UspA family protein